MSAGDHVFVDALREALGLEPLHDRSSLYLSQPERFGARVYAERPCSAPTPRRGSSSPRGPR